MLQILLQGGMLIKKIMGAPKVAQFSLLMVGLMWVLPFLYHRHAYPLTTFYQEWGAAMLGLFAMPLLLTRPFWQQPQIPRIVLLPVGLMLLVLLQFALGKIGYFSQTLLFTLYLLWAALLIMLGQRLREEFGLPVMATVMASFLLLGGELSALVGVLQHFHWHTFLDTVVSVTTTQIVFGNMGQPNHFANYVSLGLISLGLLHSRWLLRSWQVALLAAPMLFVLVLSGSRSAWLYLLCFAGMAYLWQRRDQSNRTLLYYSLCLMVGFGLMHYVVQLPWFSGDYGSVTTLDRMLKAATDFEGSGAAPSASVTERSIRLQIWYESWLIFTQFPLLGAGFGQFGWQHFLLGPSLHNPIILGLYNNAHNLVMQLAAETGLAGLLILFATLGLWVRQLLRATLTAYHWWGTCLLSILAIHSLLEYPLWYAYFIGVAALTLGMMDVTNYKLELRGVGRLSVASILLLGCISMAQVWLGYRTLENLTLMRQVSTNYFNDLIGVQGQAMLQPFVEVAMSSLVEVRADNLAEVRKLNESVMHYVPISSVCYRQVLLLALSGELSAAQLQMERSIWAFPESYGASMEQLNGFAQKDPEKFAALLEFAAKKYEEYQLAIHPK
jgi:O-antigen ligase